MANIKPLSDSSDKWVKRAGQAVGEYENGVRNPRRPWAEATVAAAASYKAGVTEAANAGRFESGVARAGNTKWQEKTLAKGPGRYPEGVAVAQDDWSDGFAPYHDAFSRLTLPKRGPRRSIQNLQRVAVVSKTFGDLFVRLKGGK